ncbi:MAG: DUF4142 domain-containing protein [Kofleriaceae bacterium]
MRTNTRSNRMFLVLSILLSAAVVGCGDDDDDADEADIQAALDAGGAFGDTVAAQAELELATVDQLTATARVGSIMHTINDGEIMQAQAVFDITDNDDAEDYAQQMIEEHTGANADLDAMLVALAIAPQENSVSAALRAEAQRSIAGLERSTSDRAARSYLLTQVQMHEGAYVLVSSMIDLGVQTSLDQMMIDMLPVIADHRDHAAELVRDM